MSSLDHLRRIADRHDQAEDREWVAARISAYLNGEMNSLDEALGLKPQQGSRRPTTVLKYEERDRLVCELAMTFLGDLLVSQQAERIARELGRYRSGADWKRDRTARDIPYRDTLRGHCWAILRTVDTPLRPRRLIDILQRAGCSDCSPSDGE